MKHRAMKRVPEQGCRIYQKVTDVVERTKDAERVTIGGDYIARNNYQILLA
jgi:hypothetical protein